MLKMKIYPASFVFSVVIVSVVFISLAQCQTLAKEENAKEFQKFSSRNRPGRYIPELHGVDGYYKIDLRGKYKHIPVPYDGGYGDSGEKYLHDERKAIGYFHNDGSDYYYSADGIGSDYDSQAQEYVRELRFAVEVNYDRKHDCRIIELLWDELGKEKYHYIYKTNSPVLKEKQNEDNGEDEQPSVTEAY